MDELAPAQRRLPSVDIARAAALLAMFGYHLTWDLAHFGFVDPRTPFSPGMRLFSHAIASAFLFLAGASLVLGQKTPFAWAPYWKHLGLIAAAAAAVTAASWFLFPEGLIFFGILHCIAAASLVALPFLFLPWFAAILAALFIAIAPEFAASDVFDGPALIWTGLGNVEPSSNDFRSFFPWAAPLLAGVGAMKLGDFCNVRTWLGHWRPKARVTNSMTFAGRHSLAVYLLHQPLFFGLLSAAVFFVQPRESAVEQAFASQCEAQCAASDTPQRTCSIACACTVTEMKSLNLWDKLATNSLDNPEKQILSSIAQGCVRRVR